jgi:NO-binding membrane sensor protein with MHYT domain
MQTRGPPTLGVSVAFFVIASVFVALRFISRIFIVRKLWLHDWLMLVAWVCGNFLAWTLHVAGVGGRDAPPIDWLQMRPPGRRRFDLLADIILDY